MERYGLVEVTFARPVTDESASRVVRAFTGVLRTLTEEGVIGPEWTAEAVSEGQREREREVLRRLLDATVGVELPDGEGRLAARAIIFGERT